MGWTDMAELLNISPEMWKLASQAEAELRDKFAEIDEINEKINELSAKLSEIKDVNICPSCGAEVSKSSAFCAKCGEKID